MKKKLGLLSLVVLSIFLMAGSAGAVSFGKYNLGVEITGKDLIFNSTYSGGSPAKGIAGEDDETEMDIKTGYRPAVGPGRDVLEHLQQNPFDRRRV